MIAVALHHGHDLREEIRSFVATSDADRLREEDPHTGDWTHFAPTRLVVRRSRFEVDLNRSRESAIYSEPAEAWGLDLWRGALPSPIRARSLALWDDFYAVLGDLVDRRLAMMDRVLVLDFHAYCHRRGGPGHPPDPPRENPEVNLGTQSMERDFWAPVVDSFCGALRSAGAPPLDVRENVKFPGGHMAHWLHDRYPRRVCVISVDARKSFMDEWTGDLDVARFTTLGEAFAAASAAALDALDVPGAAG